MAKSREGKDDEYYKGEVRKLKAENRLLKKRLKELERSKHVYEDMQLDEEIDENETQIKVERCTDCFKGALVNNDMGHGTLITCTDCTFRKFIKNGR